MDLFSPVFSSETEFSSNLVDATWTFLWAATHKLDKISERAILLHLLTLHVVVQN
jgi:hypothetical protein